MIFYLVSQAHSYTINAYLHSWGKALAFQITPYSYEQLFRAKSLKPGTYIFSDIERLNPKQADVVHKVWNKLKDAGVMVRLLNHPTHSMRRYELLRTLYEQGINEFNIYRLTESLLPQRFPVFLRGENDHAGSLTSLLKTPEELESASQEIINSSQSRDGKVIIEFCDTSDQKGIFRKYSALIVGHRIIPRHLFFSKNWQVKQPDLVDEELLLEEQHYLESNPHSAQLREIFNLAQINYGRIDYALLDGKIQVWEINTNPVTLWQIDWEREGIQSKRRALHESFARKLNSAFLALNSNTNSASCQALNWQTLG